MGLKRELSGLLGSPNPFLIGRVRLGSIKIVVALGMEIVNPLKSQLFSGVSASRVLLTDLRLCLFLFLFFGLLYLFPKGIGGGIDFSVLEIIFVGIKV